MWINHNFKRTDCKSSRGRAFKTLAVSLILLCCIQNADALSGRWGLRFGATVSRFDGEDWEICKTSEELWFESQVPGLSVTASDYWGWGYSVGILYELSLFRFLAIQPEVFYTTYHGGMKLQNDDLSFDWVKLGTIYRIAEAPILLKLRLSERLAFFSGPLLMYRFLEPKGVMILPDDRETAEMNDTFYKTLAYGVVGGVEFKTEDSVFIDIRYNYNLTSFDEFGGSWKDDTVFHSVTASVGVFY